MPRAFYFPDDKSVQIGSAESILRASLRAGIPHAHVCGGNARCSTCRIVIVEGLKYCSPRNSKEKRIADRLHFGPNIRLACQTRINGDIKLRRLVLDADDVEFTDQSAPGATPALAGEEKELAILFADIRGFTGLAEDLPPFDVIHLLNRYFNQMGSVIVRNGGQIDNYMGDGLMALFGLSGKGGAALNAVHAALEMVEAVDRLRVYFEANYAKNFRIGIGVHYGEVVVGTVGAVGSRKITAIGDAVNFASRIEAANKAKGTRILISEPTYKQVRRRVSVNRHIAVALPGRTRNCDLYEVTGLRKPR
jgi:adenylate cyclase